MAMRKAVTRSEEHTSELQSLRHLVCRLLLEKLHTVVRSARFAIRTSCHGSWRGQKSEVQPRSLPPQVHPQRWPVSSPSQPSWHCFFLKIRRPPKSTPFPDTPLSR